MKYVSKETLNFFSAKLKGWIKNKKVKTSDIDSESATSGQVLTADGSGGATWEDAGGGAFQHFIQINDNSRKTTIYTSVITASAVPFSYSSFADYLVTNGMIMGGGATLVVNNHIIASTGLSNVSGDQTIYGITGSEGTANNISAIPYQNAYVQNTSYLMSGSTVFDNVVQIA